ncbi:hypothetical protein, partial [Neisseria meningitidis]|uniref:hypothetical protein n=1 Tax=Neisseria meningitidis TaxID=487 RepID=UPI00214AE7B2
MPPEIFVPTPPHRGRGASAFWKIGSSSIILKHGGFAFEVQLSLTEKGQYAVAYGLSCKKDCHELHATD